MSRLSKICGRAAAIAARAVRFVAAELCASYCCGCCAGDASSVPVGATVGLPGGDGDVARAG